MSRRRLKRPSPALVVSVVALLVALGGTSYAAFSVPKSSVGSKQLKKNAVTTKKIKKGAVTGSKIAGNTITGDKIILSTLGVVPNATHATNADNATHATNADHAINADHATNIAAPEGMHVIGTSGEPAFQNGCSDIPASTTPVQPIAFFKDKEGIVHLQGAFQCPSSSVVAFQLPAGYQPTAGSLLLEPANGGGSSTFAAFVGSGVAPTIPAGSVLISSTGADLSGDNFRPGA